MMKSSKWLYFGMLMLLIEPVIANENPVIVKGKILNETYLGDLLGDCDKENIICMKYPYHFKIKVEELLVGRSEVKISAVEYMHMGRFYRGSHDYVFVLIPIDDAEERKLYNAEYFINEVITQRTEYCFNKPLMEYIDLESESELTSRNCFRVESIFEDLKYGIIGDITNKVLEKMEMSGDLIDWDMLDVDKFGNLYAFEDDKPKTCSEDDENSFDLEKLESCNAWKINKVIHQFQVKNGTSSKVITIINNELDRLPIENIKSELIVETKDDAEIVRWFYEVL